MFTLIFDYLRYYNELFRRKIYILNEYIYLYNHVKVILLI